jgi:23S rRNA pseudouridine1911/1915/1917 synthase
MPQSVFDWLIEKFPSAKRETLRRMVREGRVSVNGTPVRSVKAELEPDDRVRVADRGVAANVRDARRDTRLSIVYEDGDLIVVDKPAGLLTSTVPGERRATLLAQVREYVAARDPRARVGLIHRLDRDASGLLVFSKSDLAYRSLKTQFFHHTVEREYVALTEAVPPNAKGRIESRLIERADGTVHSTRASGKGQYAVTHFQVIGQENKRALLRVRLETGRKHQIRVHLAEQGTPIAGDVVYGNEKPSASRLMLVAVRIAFAHPRTGQAVSFTIPAPAAFPQITKDR